jgi:hypothetical protein
MANTTEKVEIETKETRTIVVLETKVSECCGDSARYPCLSSVLAFPRKAGGAWLSASDGRVMAFAESKDSNLPDPGFVRVPAEFKPTAKKPAWIALNNGMWSDGKKHIPEVGEVGRAPALPRSLPEKNTSEPMIALTIDTELLASLGKALADPTGDRVGITLFLPKEGEAVDRAIRVAGPSGIGVLMPLSPNWQTTTRKKLDQWHEIADEIRSDWPE